MFSEYHAMRLKFLYFIGLLIFQSFLFQGNAQSYPDERNPLLEKYRELKISGLTGSEEFVRISGKILEVDEAMIQEYRDSLDALTPVKQRILALQQEKQIYLAQNIQLSSEVQDLQKKQSSLYIVAGFLGLLFIALFILFLIQLNKIKELATETHELYQIGENYRAELAKYEKRYYVMKEANSNIRLELNKNRDYLTKREKEFEEMKKQLDEVVSRNRSLSETLKNYRKE